jgi:choline dehydrogenase-like flavoprotein
VDCRLLIIHTCRRPSLVLHISPSGCCDRPSIRLTLVLAGANVGRILLSSDSTPRATGIEFRDESDTPYTAFARREVIMATGSIKTPIILQQSGIGPSDVLSAAGVPQRVNLPIGMNLIDQTTTTTNWNFLAERGGGQPITFPRFQVSIESSQLLGHYTSYPL